MPEVVALVAFYRLRTHGITEFTIEDAAKWLLEVHLSADVESLARSMKRSARFIAGGTKGTFRLHASELSRLGAALPDLAAASEEVVAGGSVLPRAVYLETKGYLRKLCDEVNACYENNIFDGCALLMRKLIEVLLIQAFENLGLEDTIRDPDSGRPVVLAKLVKESKERLGLARWTGLLDQVRDFGNYSAHIKELNWTKRDVDGVNLLEYRVLVEQLMYMAGAKK